MYCEGGRSRTGKVAEQAKRGIGRLALETGVPVVPIAIYGSSRVRNWKRLQFPQVTVQYGEPIRWERIEHPTREQQQEVADQILVEIRKLYAGLEAARSQGHPAAPARRTQQHRRYRRNPRVGCTAMTNRLDVGAVIRRVFDIYVDQTPCCCLPRPSCS